MKKIHIKNGRLVDPANGIDAQHDLFIAGGKVVAVGTAPAGFAADHTIDAAGLVVAADFNRRFAIGGAGAAQYGFQARDQLTWGKRFGEDDFAGNRRCGFSR